MGLVYGVGTYCKGKYVATAKGKITREYNMWRGMLKRCYLHNDLSRFPTYQGCSVSKEFLDFQGFMSWAEQQIGFENESYQLDKDIIVPGNKIYAPEVCVFVPPHINMFYAFEREVKREGMPTGVCYVNCTVGGKTYTYLQAFLNDKDGKRRKLGTFNSVADASKAYIKAKKKRAVELAEEYRDKVDQRVIDCLLNFEGNGGT